MKKFLIAGGAGFIGSHLSEKLLNRGDSVICVDNYITGSRENISRLLDNPNFILVEQDIINGVPEIQDELEGIFHLASPASPNQKSERSYIAYSLETLRVNSQGTFNLLNLAKDKNAKFVYASTSEVYGNPSVSPQPETYWGNVNPNGIRSVYDEGKRFGEAMTMAYVRKFGLDARIMRIFNTYGDRMQPDDGRVVSNFIIQALQGKNITVYGDGNQTRSFCYVDDLVEGIYRLLLSDYHMPVNIGNPSEITIKEFGEEILKLTGANQKLISLPLPKDDPKQRRPDITKAKEILGWEPKVNRAEGLKITYEYFKSLSKEELNKTEHRNLETLNK